MSSSVGGRARAGDKAHCERRGRLYRRDVHRSDYACDANNGKAVEDVAAEQRADANFVVSPDARHDRGGKFGRRRANRDQRRADDEFAEFELPRDIRRAVDD